jgi:hypothetical protein
VAGAEAFPRSSDAKNLCWQPHVTDSAGSNRLSSALANQGAHEDPLKLQAAPANRGGKQTGSRAASQVSKYRDNNDPASGPDSETDKADSNQLYGPAIGSASCEVELARRSLYRAALHLDAAGLEFTEVVNTILEDVADLSAGLLQLADAFGHAEAARRMGLR